MFQCAMMRRYGIIAEARKKLGLSAVQVIPLRRARRDVEARPCPGDRVIGPLDDTHGNVNIVH